MLSTTIASKIRYGDIVIDNYLFGVSSMNKDGMRWGMRFTGV